MSKIGVDNSVREDSAKTLKLPEEEINCRKRLPKRVLHFCDGTLEEYSSEEESDSSTNAASSGPVLEANAVHWMPWFWYHTVFIGSKALAVCDYLGESLANFFGIISPKYSYEIEQYKKALAEEEERKKQDAELGSLSNTSPLSQAPIQVEPARF